MGNIIIYDDTVRTTTHYMIRHCYKRTCQKTQLADSPRRPVTDGLAAAAAAVSPVPRSSSGSL